MSVKLTLACSKVTKAHKSAHGLTKPFKAPTFVRPEAKSVPLVVPPPAPPKLQAKPPKASANSISSRPAVSDLDDDMTGNLPTEDREGED